MKLEIGKQLAEDEGELACAEKNIKWNEEGRKRLSKNGREGNSK